MGNKSSQSNLPPLELVPKCDVPRFMGTWFVIHVKPTYFEKDCCNSVEKYTCDSTSTKISIDFTYCTQRSPTATKSLPQNGWVQKTGAGALWKVQAFWPLKLPYMIIELDSDYNHCVIGYPSRAYFWIMSRTPTLDDGVYKELLGRIEKKHGYDLKGSFKVDQTAWKDREYARVRGVEKETEGM
ncbi:hypothetical protein TrCOL_g1037 [Triparma columacea]|uniref:Lipocalin/cytosolic fatty-acid binding domain-containing protein n=1 Tax=Triparma columacea TaxID=722753 RepID=A0A9W7L2U1_9STRA|nr:hypothetical protein TrCOL_g1037 [Triparma columacea]